MATTISTNIAMGGGKVTNAGTSTGSGNMAAFSQLKVRQVVFAKLETAFTFTSQTSFVDTGLSAVITPTTTSSKIFAFVSIATANHWIASASSVITLARGGSNLAPNTSGFCYVKDTAGGGGAFCTSPASFTYLDSPATTSATTYSVQVRTTNAGFTQKINDDGFGTAYTSTLTLLEVI